MVFSSMFFLWVFLPIVLVSYWLIGDRMSIHVRNGILLVASLFFYAWGEPLYILLMILSVTMNYLFARGIGDRPDDLSDAALGSASGNPSEMKSKLKIMRKRKILLTLDVVGNLFLGVYTGLLAYAASRTQLSIHLLSHYAFGSKGSVQCGFCIPGMVMSAKALIDMCPDPSEEQIKKALVGNICRCTGYKKIIEVGQVS